MRLMGEEIMQRCPGWQDDDEDGGAGMDICGALLGKRTRGGGRVLRMMNHCGGEGTIKTIEPEGVTWIRF